MIAAANDLPKRTIVRSGLKEDIAKEQSVLIQEGLMEIVDEILLGRFTPGFQETYLYRGALKVAWTLADGGVAGRPGEEPAWIEGRQP